MTPTGMTANILRSIEKRHRSGRAFPNTEIGTPSIVQIQNDCNLLLKWANEMEKTSDNPLHQHFDPHYHGRRD